MKHALLLLGFVAAIGIGMISAAPARAAYWNGYQWVEDGCGPQCQARRDQRRREEEWRRRHWHHEQEYDRGYYPPRY